MLSGLLFSDGLVSGHRKKQKKKRKKKRKKEIKDEKLSSKNPGLRVLFPKLSQGLFFAKETENVRVI